jgi:enoyl-CoA hydratase/carnithine racemase
MTCVRAERLYRGQVLRLTLCAPPGNVIDGTMVDALLAALPENTDDLKLILLAAEGPDFSIGTRLEAADMARFHQVFYRLIDLGIPTAALVRGRCMDAGFELAAFCNFVFADASARFGLRRGLPTPAALILPLKLGAERAGDLVLCGLTVDAVEAFRRGLLTAWAPERGDVFALHKAWIETHLLPCSAVRLRRAHRVARLSFHAQLRAELPALERLYLANTQRHKAVA